MQATRYDKASLRPGVAICRVGSHPRFASKVGDPVADWERPRVIALKAEGPRTTLMRQPTVAIGQVFRCGETLRQRRDRYTENRTHHVGTLPAV